MHVKNYKRYQRESQGSLPETIEELANTFEWPIREEFYLLTCNGDYVSMGQSEHLGVDLLVPCETQVFAPISGSLSFEEDQMNPINRSELTDATIKYAGLECYLRHLDFKFVPDSDRIDQNQEVGRVGEFPGLIYNEAMMQEILEQADGRLDHLHIEFSYRGQNINPLLLLKRL